MTACAAAPAAEKATTAATAARAAVSSSATGWIHDRALPIRAANTGSAEPSSTPKKVTRALVNSYATLGAMGVYRPVWEYHRQTLAQDASAHLVFGLATALAYRLLAPSGAGR